MMISDALSPSVMLSHSPNDSLSKSSQERKRNDTLYMSSFFYLCNMKRKSNEKMPEKRSALSSLNRLRIERICKNAEEWDSLWMSVAGDKYLNMTHEEIRNFNASLNVIANDTMNTLSALRKCIGSTKNTTKLRR